jgi:hypothetical protein
VKNYTKAYKKLKITTETYECALKTLDLNQNAIGSFELLLQDSDEITEHGHRTTTGEHIDLERGGGRNSGTA